MSTLTITEKERERLRTKKTNFVGRTTPKFFDKRRNGSGHQGGTKLTAAIKKKKTCRGTHSTSPP